MVIIQELLKLDYCFKFQNGKCLSPTFIYPCPSAFLCFWVIIIILHLGEKSLLPIRILSLVTFTLHKAVTIHKLLKYHWHVFSTIKLYLNRLIYTPLKRPSVTATWSHKELGLHIFDDPASATELISRLYVHALLILRVNACFPANKMTTQRHQRPTTQSPVLYTPMFFSCPVQLATQVWYLFFPNFSVGCL